MKEIGTRVISGLVMSTAYMLIISTQGFFYIHLLLFGIGVIYLGTNEFFKLFFKEKVDDVIRFSTLIIGIAISVIIYILSLKGAHYLPMFSGMPRWLVSMTRTITPEYIMAAVFILIFFLFVYQIVTDQIEGAGRKIANSLLCITYIAAPVSLLYMIRGQTYGVFYLWFISWIVVMSDIVAFFFGKTMGKHRLKWKISPNKTWEGYIGGLLGTILSTILFYEIYKRVGAAPVLSVMQILALSSVFYVIGALGDLAESLLKRSQSVKDTGDLIPGHGGVLDRVDSMLLALPAFYLVEKFFL